MIDVPMPMFKLGSVVATPACLEAFEESNEQPWTYLSRHLMQDWGDLTDEDKAANDLAIEDGSRILSAYVLKSGVRIWIITEAADENGNRAATTLLLSEEY